MSRRSLLMAASTLAMSFAITVPASAFDFLHREPHAKALACYKKVQTPDIYRTVGKRVIVRAAWSETRSKPAVYGTRRKRVMVKPGWWETRSIPAVYGSRKKRVLVRAARTTWHTTPAVYSTRHVTRVVRPATTKWVEKRSGLLGRETKMCKVVVPAVTRIVARQVMVSGPKRRASHQAAIYNWTADRVLLKPARHKRVYHAPRYEVLSERVVMSSARSYVVNHPAEYGTRHQQVLVKRGGTAWQRVAPGC